MCIYAIQDGGTKRFKEQEKGRYGGVGELCTEMIPLLHTGTAQGKILLWGGERVD